MIKYGGGTADFAFYKGEIIPGQKYTLWDDNDNQLTTLWDAGGVPVPDAQVQADVFGMVEFYTEDGVFPVYAKAVGDTSGLKVRMDPSTITEDLYDSIATTAGLSSRVASLEGSQDTQDVEIATISDQINAILDELATPGGAGVSSRAVIFLDDTAFGAIGDGVNDDAPAWQAALDQLLTLGGGTLFVPAGVYKVNSELEIKSPCRIILDPNATVIRGSSSMQYIFRNFNSTTVTTVYGGVGNIHIQGGIIDGGATTMTTACTSFIVAHAEHVRIQDVIFQNVVDWHAVELNSTRNAVVSGCTFRGFKVQTSSRYMSEAIQLDLAKDSSVLPGIGAGSYDNTPCTNIKIVNNTCTTLGSFKSFGALTGSHTAVDTKLHTHVEIANNYCTDLNDYMVTALNWQNVTITGNICRNSNSFLYIAPASGSTVDIFNFAITGNVCETMGVQNNAPAINDGCIYLAGNDASAVGNVIRHVAMTGNHINISANPVAAIYAVNVANLVVSGGGVKNVTTGAYVVGCRTSMWEGVKFATCSGDGMHVLRGTNTNSRGTTITGCVFDTYTFVGCYLQATGVKVTNCYFSGSATSGQPSIRLLADTTLQVSGARYRMEFLICGNIFWLEGSSGGNGVQLDANVAHCGIFSNVFSTYGTNTSSAASGVTNTAVWSISDGSNTTETRFTPALASIFTTVNVSY